MKNFLLKISSKQHVTYMYTNAEGMKSLEEERAKSKYGELFSSSDIVTKIIENHTQKMSYYTNTQVDFLNHDWVAKHIIIKDDIKRQEKIDAIRTDFKKYLNDQVFVVIMNKENYTQYKQLEEDDLIEVLEKFRLKETIELSMSEKSNKETIKNKL